MYQKYIAYRGVCFDIEWYLLPSGKVPGFEYYETLDLTDKKKFWTLIKTMGDIGQIRNKEKFRNEDDYIYAFKPGPNRFLCFFVKDSKIIITNAFLKKTNKLPKSEKEKAMAYRNNYLTRTKKGTYYEE